MGLKVAILSVVLIVSGCASVHSGYYAKDISGHKNDLLISGDLSLRLSSEYFGYIVITMENQSEEWLELSDLKIDFQEDVYRENISAIRGPKLAQWQRSINLRNKVASINESLALGTLLTVGAVAAHSNNSSTSRAGVNTVLASGGALTAKSISNEIASINDSSAVPDSHLLYGSVLVPPKLSTKKWIVLNSKNHKDMEYKDNFIFTFRDQNNKKYKYNVKYVSRKSNYSQFLWKL